MKAFLKQRLGKNAGRLFLHDRELADTVFQPGTHYRYVVDLENRKLLILPTADQEGNTVCQRKLKNSIKPLIDIRDKVSLAIFEGCSHLQITIYGDEVIVEGFVTEIEGPECQRAQSSDSALSGESPDISDVLSVRKKVEIVLSFAELNSLVGLEQGWAELISTGFNQSHLLRQAEIPLKVLSLFSGAGLMDYGFIKEGFDIVFAMDFDQYACETYRHNLGDHICYGDVTKLTVRDFPSVPIIIGGTPCQGFSKVNKHTNYLDNPNNKLIREYVRVVKENSSTKVFVLENVPELLSIGDGAFIREIEESLSDFEITSGVVSAADMGSSQQRRRSIVIGSKIGRIELPKPIVSVLNTVRTAFSGLSDDLPNQRDYSVPKNETLDRIRQIPEGGNWRDLTSVQDPRHHSNYLKRLLWDMPAITLANVRKLLILHPSENRILSVREMARLFDLPDWYRFFGPLGEKQQQVVNGVPVKLASAVARVVKEAIHAYNRKCMCVLA